MIGKHNNYIKDVSSPKTAYIFINIAFMAIIMAILIYSALYKYNNNRIPALLTQRTGIIPPSKGLSASFAEIVKGNFSEAIIINPHSVRVFSFFAIQLIMRLTIIVILRKNWIPRSRLTIIDVSISVILFIVCFAPLIWFTVKLFGQFLH